METTPLGKKCAGGQEVGKLEGEKQELCFQPPSDPPNSVKSLGGILPEFVLCSLHTNMCTSKHSLGFVRIFIQMGSHTAYRFPPPFNLISLYLRAFQVAAGLKQHLSDFASSSVWPVAIDGHFSRCGFVSRHTGAALNIFGRASLVHRRSGFPEEIWKGGCHEWVFQ